LKEKTMSKETTDAGKQGDWQRLLASLAANVADLTHLEPLRAQLATQLERAVEINRQQAGLIAGKQEMSKQLRQVIVEGDRLATLLRSAVRQHYGIRTEKVVEFGVQPFRGRAFTRRTRKPKANPAPEPVAAADTPQ
jgi:hypothetical protein